MNIHLITYLTSKLFWIYTVFRYNTILYPKDEDTQKLFAYFCAYLLSCWGSMQWGTMYGDLIFELIALLIITVAYQADWQHHVWNTLMVYIMGILCDGIPIVFFQRYAVARNPVHHHMGPGTIVMGNFIFFLLEVIIERKVDVKRSYYIKNSHWLAMLSVPVISIIVCIRILLPDRRGVRSTIVLFLLFINVFIFYLHDEVQKSYIETAKQEEMKIQMSQYAKELEMMMKSQDRLNKIHHDYKHHLITIGAMAKTGGNEEILSYLKQMENIARTALCHHLYTENRNMNNLLNYILEDSKSVIENPEISVEIPNHIGEELFDISIIVGNLMDNAIRGTAASDERRLSFQMYYGKGIMNIQIENSIKDTPKVRNGIYLTTKSRKEGHGIGLQNVKLVVEKYHGQMEICHTEKSFQVKILLYMKLDEK